MGLSQQHCRAASPGRAALLRLPPFLAPTPSAVALRVISPAVPVVKGLSGAELLAAVVCPRVGVKSPASGSSVPFDPLIQVSPWCCCIPAAEFLSSHEQEPDSVPESFIMQSWKLIDSEMFPCLL